LASPARIYQPFGAASQAASYTDLVGNEDAGVGVAPTWTAEGGWGLNGVDQYLTTSFVPDHTDASQTLIVQFANVTNNGALAGAYVNVVRGFDLVPNAGTGKRWYQNGIRIQNNPAVLSGNMAVAGLVGYLNGAVDEPVMVGWSGSASGRSVYIGCWNAGAPAAYIAATIQAVALCDEAESAETIATVAAALADIVAS
jgi:hypothetical protein